MLASSAAKPLAGAEIFLAQPRGFCAGVERAIAIADQALQRFGAPVYVRHEIVHNRFVVEGLRQRGAVFVEDLQKLPEGAVTIFSAHGVSRSVRAEAEARRLQLFDATCPLVTKVHSEVRKLHAEGYTLVMIGHRGHPEVEGTMGQVQGGIHLVENERDIDALPLGSDSKVAVVTQTTLSVNDTARLIEHLRARFPALREPKRQDICYATQNRQDAVQGLAARCDIIIVAGSPNSSNSNRLCEIAQRAGTQALLIESAEELASEIFSGKARIGVTAGASAPEQLVQQILARLQLWGAEKIHALPGVAETVKFPLPAGLRMNEETHD